MDNGKRAEPLDKKESRVEPLLRPGFEKRNRPPCPARSTRHGSRRAGNWGRLLSFPSLPGVAGLCRRSATLAARSSVIQAPGQNKIWPPRPPRPLQRTRMWRFSSHSLPRSRPPHAYPPLGSTRGALLVNSFDFPIPALRASVTRQKRDHVRARVSIRPVR